MSASPRDPMLPVDGEARVLARRLVRTARSGSLATNDGPGGFPFASLVAVATDIDGSPIILTSELSTHTGLLTADPKCSLLVSAIGKGDPLAHPRLTILATARRLEGGESDLPRVRNRYLALHPKAALYVDFPDFGFWRLEVEAAHLNGGFGRAYRMGASDILTATAALEDLAALEAEAVAHMNADHAEAVALYATRLCSADPGPWKLATIDADGAQLVLGDRVIRLDFPRSLTTAAELRPMLMSLARTARGGAGE